MKIFVYPCENLLFEWPYFEECTKVQDLFLSQLKSNVNEIKDADIAFFPLMLGSAFQHQKSPHSILSKQPNLQYEWRKNWSKLIKHDDKIKHFVLLSYVLFNVNLSFIPSHFTILCYETEVTMDIHGGLTNFGCYNRIITIPYYVELTSDILYEKSINILFIGSLKHASKYREPLINFLKPTFFEPSKDLNYLEIYSKSKLSLVLRGDTPTRCAFYQSLLSNCCPIIFKHCLLHYKNLYNGILPIEDLCIILPDYDFDNKILTDDYKKQVQEIIYQFNSIKFIETLMKYKDYFDYSKKKENLSMPIYYSLEAVYTGKKQKLSEPIVFIANLDKKYNLAYLPTIINTRDIVIGNETSQYELEIHWHKQIQNNYIQTHCIEMADFVFIPFYTFLSGWKDGVFSNRRIANKLEQLIENLPSWKKYLNIPHILIYSDVCWNSEDSFINLITSWPSNTVLISLESIKHPIIKTLTSPYLSGFNDIQLLCKKIQFLTYIGRMRLPFESLNQKIENCKFSFIEIEGWKSINEEEFTSHCISLYSNSIFSLQPPGDRETRRGFFQSILCNCIPVIFQDNIDGYQQHTQIPLEDICVIIPFYVKDISIQFIIEYLSGINPKKYTHINRSNYIFQSYNSKPVLNIIHKVLFEKKII